MKKQKAVSREVETLKEDARALLRATADIVENRVVEARRRLSEAIGAGKETCREVNEKVVTRAKAADRAIRRNPYQVIGVAIGVGALLGFMMRGRGAGRQTRE
jgi:ElaB/YqjD/DUF883 family membrane-anchored ribosome-binding protein